MVLSLSPASKHALSGACSRFLHARSGPFLWDDGSALTPLPPVTARKSLLLSLHNVWETLAISAPTLVDAYRGTLTRDRCDDRLEGWASRLVSNAEMMISVHGRENVKPEHLGRGPHAYLVMSNHQSHYDVPVIFYVLGSTLRMVAKRELFDLPVFGPALRKGGFIPIDRKDKERAMAGLDEARRALEAGTPIWMAPEGTRSPTGKLLPFKKGGFVLALATGSPVLPVTVRGTRDALRAKGLRSRKGAEVSVTIHPAIDPAQFADLGPKNARDALAEEVRRAIASAL